MLILQWETFPHASLYKAEKWFGRAVGSSLSLFFVEQVILLLDMSNSLLLQI